MLSRRYRRLQRRRQRQHKSAEGKTFWARSCRSVCPRANARMRTYMHTYVYVVLSDGTRGCCGLIYRLSLPWKPRRDRLARHPHIRVDSGLLYSPPRLLSPSPPLPSFVALYASLYLLLVLALLRPHLVNPLRPPASLRPPLSARLHPLPPAPPLLSFFAVYAIYVSLHQMPPRTRSLFLSWFALCTSSCLSKRVFLFDSFVLSFLRRVIPSRFCVPDAFLLSHHPVSHVHAVSP